ncbi:MAG: Gx transporter family protein [Lachnospiraceae bacterium]|nr:Gx transporter family protein [Lachnospiraceae bacterium]
MMRSRSRMTAVSAVFSALGIILGYIETFIVIPVRIPGIRIGLANIVSILGLYLFGPVWAALILFVRVMLSGMLFGTPVSFVYSIFGALVSLTVMIVAKCLKFSVYGVSVLGAVSHNIAQIVVAMFLMNSRYVITYIPALVIAGVVTGILIGALSYMILKRLRGVFINESEGMK